MNGVILINPIFNEYIQFLRDSSCDKLEWLQEGFFWLDRQIIKGFDKQGNIHKFYKVNISDSMKLGIEKKDCYDDINKIEVISWKELIELHKQRLEEIESQSLSLIESKMQKFSNYIPLIPISTGKDSQITLHLVRQLFPNAKAIFNNTSLDCSETYHMIKTIPNCEIMSPKQGFYQYVKESQMIPTRFSRFCCRIFKTGEMVKRLDYETPYLLFLGMRNDESGTRSDYGDEWINEAEWGDTNWQGILPIRQWSELDVWLYTLWKNIKINSKYKKGYVRVGCHIACPFYTKSTWVLDKYWYPKMRERWENILRQDFITNNKWLVMNCTIDEYMNCRIFS